MVLIERYVARQVLRTALTALAVVVAALLLERMLRLIREADAAHLPLGLAAQVLLAKLPEMAGIALPPALFAGVLLGFQRLARDRELDVLAAAGASLWRTARPVALLTVATAAIALAVFWFLLPHGRYAASRLMHQAAQEALTAPLPAGTFTRVGDGVLYLQPRGERAGLFLYQPGPRGPTVTTAVAEGFRISRSSGTLSAQLHDGRRATFRDGGGHSSLLSFADAREPLRTAGPRPFRPRGAQAVELTWPELRLAAAGSAPALAQLHVKAARVLLVLLLPLVALPLALAVPVRHQGLAAGAGAALLLAIDQALIYGETVVGLGQRSPWDAIWSVVAALVAVAAALWAAAGPRATGRRW